MSRQTSVAPAADPAGKWLYRVGGLSALLIGAGYVIIIGLYLPVGAPPHGGDAWLRYLDGKTAIWWAILGLSVLTDVLFIPVALALFHALKDINRGAMQVATALVGLFVALDLAVLWPNYAALITLSGQYATATGDAQRAAAVAAATYASAVLASSLEAVYSIATLAVGILLIGFVMRASSFGKVTASVGIATGLFGIVAVAGPYLLKSLAVAVIIASVLTTVWVVLVGYQLYRLGRS
jgi:hypothetical protein